GEHGRPARAAPRSRDAATHAPVHGVDPRLRPDRGDVLVSGKELPRRGRPRPGGAAGETVSGVRERHVRGGRRRGGGADRRARQRRGGAPRRRVRRPVLWRPRRRRRPARARTPGARAVPRDRRAGHGARLRGGERTRRDVHPDGLLRRRPPTSSSPSTCPHEERPMNDYIAIQDLITRLLFAVDALDWAGVRAAFADEVEVDYTSLFGGSP